MVDVRRDMKTKKNAPKKHYQKPSDEREEIKVQLVESV